MFCVYCGWENPADAAYCSNCGRGMGAEKPSPVRGNYAGLGQRFGAWAIDGILTAILSFVFVMLAGPLTRPVITSLIGLDNPLLLTPEVLRNMPAAAKGAVVLMFLTLLALPQWLYFALQESSSSMATIGKKMTGIQVTDYDGKRIGFGQASLRFVVKWVATILPMVNLVSAILIVTGLRAQAVHDMLARTEVRRRY